MHQLIVSGNLCTRKRRSFFSATPIGWAQHAFIEKLTSRQRAFEPNSNAAFTERCQEQTQSATTHKKTTSLAHPDAHHVVNHLGPDDAIAPDDQRHARWRLCRWWLRRPPLRCPGNGRPPGPNRCGCFPGLSGWWGWCISQPKTGTVASLCHRPCSSLTANTTGVTILR